MLRPTSSIYCCPSSLDFLDEVSGLRDMNWCKYVLDGLIEGAADFHKQLKSVEDVEKKFSSTKGMHASTRGTNGFIFLIYCYL